MAIGLELNAMPKTRGRPRSDRDDVSAKLDRSVVGMAKMIATYKGISAAELMSEMLRAPIGRAYAQMLREIDSKEAG